MLLQVPYQHNMIYFKMNDIVKPDITTVSRSRNQLLLFDMYI